MRYTGSSSALYLLVASHANKLNISEPHSMYVSISFPTDYPVSEILSNVLGMGRRCGYFPLSLR